MKETSWQKAVRPGLQHKPFRVYRHPSSLPQSQPKGFPSSPTCLHRLRFRPREPTCPKTSLEGVKSGILFLSFNILLFGQVIAMILGQKFEVPNVFFIIIQCNYKSCFNLRLPTYNEDYFRSLQYRQFFILFLHQNSPLQNLYIENNTHIYSYIYRKQGK